MKSTAAIVLVLGGFLAPTAAFSQAFGEYGRVVGGVPQGVGPRAPRGGSSSGSVVGGVGSVAVPNLPSRLIVGASGAPLFARQDDETEAILVLTNGEKLTPMVQSGAMNEWFMVRTEKGIIGWVKSDAVQKDAPEK